MDLGDKFGLLYRTVLVPAARTAWVGRDASILDVEGRLRSVRYTRPSDVPRQDFERVYLLATGKTRPRVSVQGPLVLIGFMLPAGILIRVGAMPTLSIALFVLIGCMVAQSLLVSIRGNRIPFVAEVARVRDAWIAAGRCPSCAHCIAAQSPSDDSRARCNECGALWQIPPVQDDSGASAPT